jgi:hypothetical protein
MFLRPRNGPTDLRTGLPWTTGLHHTVWDNLRFNAFVSQTPTPGGCLEWLGALDDDGYGSYKVDEDARRAHRVAYELHRGPISVGLTIDHVCANKACVNPWHLDCVTTRENTHRYHRRRHHDAIQDHEWRWRRRDGGVVCGECEDRGIPETWTRPRQGGRP